MIVTEFVTASGTNETHYNTTVTASTTCDFKIDWNWCQLFIEEKIKELLADNLLRLQVYRKSFFRKIKVFSGSRLIPSRRKYNIFIPAKKDWRGIESYRYLGLEPYRKTLRSPSGPYPFSPLNKSQITYS